jgi:hypothetical protein
MSDTSDTNHFQHSRREARLSLNGGRHTGALVVRPPVSRPAPHGGFQRAGLPTPPKTRASDTAALTRSQTVM